MSLFVNHRFVRQVTLVYMCGMWVLFSAVNYGTHLEGSHQVIDEADLHQVAARLDAQVEQWLAQGHRVRCFRRLPTAALDAG